MPHSDPDIAPDRFIPSKFSAPDDSGPASPNDSAARAHSPTVQRIADGVRNSILRGEYAEGRRLPSEAEIARRYGVSRIPVRQALDLVAEEGYLERAPRCRPVVRRPQGGSAIPTGQNGTRAHPGVPLILYWSILSVAFPLNAGIQVGIQNALDPERYRLTVETARSGNGTGGYAAGSAATREAEDSVQRGLEVIEAERRSLERFAADPEIAGILLWATGTPENMPTIQRLRDAGKALVFVDPVDYVGVDNAGSARNVVRHLLSLGHRRIAHVTNNERVNTVRERAEGYRLALEEAGLPFDPARVLPSTFDDAFLDALLNHRDGPATAVFAVNDGSAYRTIEALRGRGLRVPEDISVAGFDGDDSLYGRPPFLTTARQPVQRLGLAAATLLVERLEARSPTLTLPGASPAFRHILLEAPLAVHGSTAPPLA
jgi:DNA-binding LacI/PurR family transcriptional regulator